MSEVLQTTRLGRQGARPPTLVVRTKWEDTRGGGGVAETTFSITKYVY